MRCHKVRNFQGKLTVSFLGDDDGEVNSEFASPSAPRPPPRPPPLARLYGVVRGGLVSTLIDMGSQAHIITTDAANSLGLSIRASTRTVKAASGHPLRVVGATDLRWSSRSSRFEPRGSPTVLSLTDVLVVDGTLPAQLLIGVRCIYGSNPRQITFSNVPGTGFRVQFVGRAPLPLLTSKKDSLLSLQSSCAALRAALPDAVSTFGVVDEVESVLPSSQDEEPAVTRDQQPVPRESIEGIAYGPDALRNLLAPTMLADFPGLFLADGETPRVMPGVVYAPQLRHDADLDALAHPVTRLSKAATAANCAEAARLLRANGAEHAQATPFRAMAYAVAKRDENGKVTGKFRTVGAYQHANAALVRDAYPMRDVSDIVRAAASGRCFSVVDLASAFEQIAFARKALPITATFYAPGYFLVRKTGSFGLEGLPATLQRTLDRAFAELPYVFPYFDDIVIVHTSEEPSQIAMDVRAVFAKLASIGAAVKSSKVRLAVVNGPLLGYTVGPGTITPNVERLQAWSQLPPPKTHKLLRSFLGALSHYAEHFTSVATLTAAFRTLQSRADDKSAISWTKSLDDAFQRLKRYVLDMCTVGGRATLAPLPGEPACLYLATDWNRNEVGLKGGVGWVLYSNDPATHKQMIISCGSRSLPSARIYNRAMRGEVFALQCAVARLRHVLCGRHVRWLTDCKSAAQAFVAGNSESTSVNDMLVDVQSNFPGLTAHWVPREQNHMADLFAQAAPLGAQPVREPSDSAAADETISVITEIIEALANNRYKVRMSDKAEAQICRSLQVKRQVPEMLKAFLGKSRDEKSSKITLDSIVPVPAGVSTGVECPPQSEPAVDDSGLDVSFPPLAVADGDGADVVPEVMVRALPSGYPAGYADAARMAVVRAVPESGAAATTACSGTRAFCNAIIAAQRSDPSIAHIYRAALLKSQSPETVLETEFQSLPAAERAQISALAPVLQWIGLVTVTPLVGAAAPPRIVLPALARPSVLLSEHERAHYAASANLASLARCFWWPRMAQDVAEVARSCRTCQEARQQRRRADIGAPRVSAVPMEKGLVDLQGPFNEPGHVLHGLYLVTIMDVATRFLWVAPVPTKHAAVVLKAFNRATAQFGKFSQIYADQGREFYASFRSELELGGTRVLHGAAYDHNVVAPLERAHRTTKAIIAKLSVEGRARALHDLVNEVTNVMNYAVRDDCKLSPFECMFGRPSPLPSAARHLLEADMLEAERVYGDFPFVGENVARNVAALQTAVILANDNRVRALEQSRPLPWAFAVGDLVMMRGAPATSSLQSRVPHLGPFVIDSLSDNGHIANLSKDGVVVQTSVAVARLAPFVDPVGVSVLAAAGDVSKWLLVPGHQVQSHWVDQSVWRSEFAHRQKLKHAGVAAYSSTRRV